MVQPERNNREPVSGDAVSRPTAPRDKLDLRTLDALRGVAALYVVVCHASALLWSGMNPAGRSGLAANVFHGLVDYFVSGREAAPSARAAARNDATALAA